MTEWMTCACTAPNGTPWRGVPHDCDAVQRGEGDHSPPAVIWQDHGPAETADANRRPSMNYPDDCLACIMCGAAEGKHCTYISTVDDGLHDPQIAGEQRPYPHAARAKVGEQAPEPGFVPVKDEGPW